MEFENEEEIVHLIAGKINATGGIFYWKSEKCIANMIIGNYLIVENRNGYDLVQIVGIMKVAKKDVGRFSNTNYENMKRVIKEIKI